MTWTAGIDGGKMRKLTIVFVLVAIVVMAAGWVYAATVACPIDGSSAYFTGKTQNDISGHLLYQYRCTGFGHLFWVAQ
jgi:hypothetical protein